MRNTPVWLLIIFMIAAAFPPRAYAGFARCRDIFEVLPKFEIADSTVIESNHPFIQEKQLSEIAAIKTKADDEVFKDFEKPKNLHIRVGYGLHTKPVQAPLQLGYPSIYLPFDYPKAAFSKYISQQNPPRPDAVSFQTLPIFIHEYSHAVLIQYLRTQNRRYDAFFKYFENKLKQGLSEDQICEIMGDSCDLRQIARARFIVVPYDEFLADFAAVLFTENPDSVRQQLLKLPWDLQHGTFYSFIRRKLTSREPARNFKTHYRKSIDDYAEILLDSPHDLLGPARSAVWRLYLKNKKLTPKHVFFRKVVETTVEIVNARIMSESTKLTEHETYDLLSQGTTVESINLDLIRKLESIDFTKP